MCGHVLVCDAQAMSVRDGRAMTDVCVMWRSVRYRTIKQTSMTHNASRQPRPQLECRTHLIDAYELASTSGKGVEGGWGEMEHVHRYLP